MAGIQSSTSASADVLAALRTNNATGAAKENSSADQQSKFLTLLVAQMKNQDPLNPVDNAQVTSQLAQISTVDGIERLNSTMKTIVGSNESTQAVQAASLAGRQVLVTGNALTLSGGKAFAGFELAQAVDSLKISITDASGATVHEVDMGAQPAGIHAFEWDGATDSGNTSADGGYTFKLKAIAQGQNVDVTALAAARVDGVSRGSDGLSVSVGTLGSRTLDQVRRIM
jgi:flagellar basal-body rod modification protein FlgD